MFAILISLKFSGSFRSSTKPKNRFDIHEWQIRSLLRNESETFWRGQQCKHRNDSLVVVKVKEVLAYGPYLLFHFCLPHTLQDITTLRRSSIFLLYIESYINKPGFNFRRATVCVVLHKMHPTRISLGRTFVYYLQLNYSPF